MQRVLSTELWKIVRTEAGKARRRQAAIAYMTQDLLGFRRGDTLIVNASRNAIASGETDARLLRSLNNRGVHIHNCPTLHAKVLLLDNLAVVGSSNMSSSSASALIEAAVMTDHHSAVSGVASLLEQLRSQSRKIEVREIAELCRIRVVRRGGLLPGLRRNPRPKISRLGNKTWLIGVKELANEPPPNEQKKIDLAERALRAGTGDPDFEPDWIRWTGRSRFRRKCREGDSVIQIFRTEKAERPAAVYRSCPVLMKQSTRKWTRFYVKGPSGKNAEMSWGRFRNLLRELGYSKYVGPTTTVLLDPELADAVDRNWRKAARS